MFGIHKEESLAHGTFPEEFILPRNPKNQQQCHYPVVRSEGLYKGIFSSISHKEELREEKNAFLESIVVPSRSVRDTEWDPGLLSSIPVFQHPDSNTTSSYTP